MQTRANSIVRIDSARVGKRLPIVEAWANSSHVMLVYTDCVLSRLFVKVGGVEGFCATVSGTFHPVAGYWHFYIPRTALTACETFYKIVSSDLNGNRDVLGEGVLRIYKSLFDDPADSAGGEEASDNAYIKVGANWYAIRVGADDSGALSFELVGVSSAPEGATGTPYAYCPQDGLYHKVYAEEDESGTLSFSVDSEGEEAQGSFALGSDGFYHRIEAVDDGTGLALQVGERQ